MLGSAARKVTGGWVRGLVGRGRNQLPSRGRSLPGSNNRRKRASKAASGLMRRLGFSLSVLLLASCQTVPRPDVPLAPRTAYHQHLVSPATAALLNGPVIDGAALLRM